MAAVEESTSRGPPRSARRRRRATEWQGRGSIAYVTKASKETFDSLPEEVHQRLQTAASQLQVQNSVVPRLFQGKHPAELSLDDTSLALSTLERYELARYKVDNPTDPKESTENRQLPGSHGSDKRHPSRSPRGRVTRSDYSEHLISSTTHWKATVPRLRDVESFRTRLAELGRAALTQCLQENGVSTELCPSNFQCFGSYHSGLALSDSHLDVLLGYDLTTPIKVLNQFPLRLVRAFLAAGLCATTASSPLVSGRDVIKVCESPSAELLETLRNKYEQNPADKRPVYLPESLGLQCHIHFSPHAMMYYNSDLMRCYHLCDDRVPQMARVVKKWARMRKIDGPENGMLSGYGYMLMLLHYLLHVADPPVVPNLLSTKLGTRNPHRVAGRTVDYWSNRREIAANARAGTLSRNNQSAASLLRGFFAYYASSGNEFRNYQQASVPPFIWKFDAVSARQRGLKKRDKGWMSNTHRDVNGARHWNFIAIEDPLAPDQNVAAFIHPIAVTVIRDEFSRAATILSRSKFIPGTGWEWRTDEGTIGDELLAIRNPSAAELAQFEKQRPLPYRARRRIEK